jgi:branched-chain amino acid aminotransferase
VNAMNAMNAMNVAWVDGSFERQISPHDEGFLSGLAVFETIGVFDGALPLWSAHLARLERDALALEIPFSPRDDLRSSAEELLTRAPVDDIVRITLAAGVDGRPTWCMTTRRRSGRDSPVRLHLTDPVVPGALAAIKTTSRAAHVLASRAARLAGADDALLVDPDGRVLETTTANVFLRCGDELRTPRLDGSILPGVAREVLLEKLAARGMHVRETDCAVQDIENGDGFFVTNAVYGPRPASLLDVDVVPLEASVREAWQNATVRSDD